MEQSAHDSLLATLQELQASEQNTLREGLGRILEKDSDDLWVFCQGLLDFADDLQRHVRIRRLSDPLLHGLLLGGFPSIAAVFSGYFLGGFLDERLSQEDMERFVKTRDKDVAISCVVHDLLKDFLRQAGGQDIQDPVVVELA